MKKLLFVAGDIAGWGGTERALNLVASTLSDRFEVEVLSFRDERECVYRYPAKVKLHWIGQRGLFGRNLAFARALRRITPDTVILAGIGDIKHILASLPLRRFKFIAWEHFNAAMFYAHRNRRAAAFFADTVIALTKQDASDWKRLLGPRGDVVAMPNPVPSFPPRAAALDSKRILSVGRLDGQKRFDLLIEAFALVAPEIPGWGLRIRGQGPDETALKRLAKERALDDRVEILPPTGDMASEYATASLYAMSSRFEGFPMVLLEAMAAGLPCVSVDCPNGPREIISDGIDGLVTPQDAVALAGAIKHLALDAGMRKGMGAKARENIGRYSIGRIADLWTDLIETK